MANNHSETERRLWDAADEFRANSDLKSSEYATPVLGLIFLRYADHRFAEAEKQLEGKGSGRRKIGREDYQAKGVMFLPPTSRFSQLLSLPEGKNIGKAINDAMKAVEADNEELKGVLPKSYTKIENSTLVSLLKNFSQIAVDAEGDTFGKIYEYFLGNFARAEGQRGGEFFTPTSLVKLIVEIIEPYHGRIFDPAAGSGGMFAQSAGFIKAHKKKPSVEISCYGQERVGETRQLCMMNLAVHSMSGDIRLGNSYYEDLHESLGKFDFVMANPPFNVDKVDKEKIKDDPRYPFGMPRADNANYLWMQLFYSSLNETGQAGFVMDVAGLCKVATLEEIEEQGWSLNPGRYVGVADREEDDFEFAERLEELNEELEVLNSEAGELEERIANNCLNNQFLYYTFLHYGQTERFSPLFTGATIKHLPREKLALVEFDVPPLPTQRKIASILSAYDDLIENNTRRIAILEEMARAIYREWFVNFRFPGHENVKLVDSPLGMIPERWEATRWGELATLEYGKGLRGYKDREGPVPVFGTNGRIGFHDEALCHRAGIIIGRKGAYRGVEYSHVPFWVIDVVEPMVQLEEATA